MQVGANSMETTYSKKSWFVIFYVEKPKIIGLFSEYGCVVYITKRENIKRQIKCKIYKAIMVGYYENLTRDM